MGMRIGRGHGSGLGGQGRPGMHSYYAGFATIRAEISLCAKTVSAFDTECRLVLRSQLPVCERSFPTPCDGAGAIALHVSRPA